MRISDWSSDVCSSDLDCGAHTVPYIEVRNPSAQIEHEATTSKISDDRLFYAMSRGLSAEDAVALIVNGFCREVLQQLPMEFAVEAQKLLGRSEEHTSELQSLMSISYAVLCLKKKTNTYNTARI